MTQNNCMRLGALCITFKKKHACECQDEIRSIEVGFVAGMSQGSTVSCGV